MLEFRSLTRILAVAFACQVSVAFPAGADPFVSPLRVLQDYGSYHFGIFPGAGGPIHLSSFERAQPSQPASRSIRITGGSSVEQLKSLIAQAEAGRAGYDAVHHRAARLPRNPTAMTVREIYDWIAATPGRPHAIGRYQFIPATLRRLVTAARVSPDTPFSPALQDHLADMLLEEAGLSDFLRREMSAHRFMDNLALIWAGLPTSTGRSAYHDYAGNRATITRVEYETTFARIFR